MSFRAVRKVVVGHLASKSLAFAIGFAILHGIAVAEEHSFSERYAIEVDPSAKELVGERVFDEVMAFFHNAEKAIEAKDLTALMNLYSENYSDGEHDKKSAEQIWKRIFSTFDAMATRHNMRFVNISPEKGLVIIRCSGLLVGMPKSGKGVIAIDNWNQQDHVLIQEGGRWRLIGSFGRQRKRLWFDKPMHPLF